jgi:hypothetical protein
VLIGLAVGSLVTACAHNVAQDSATGADGKIKGAKPMPPLDNGESKASGIVTYPGGDRVDWRMIELPKDKKGSLDLTLTWQPPRPGLQLSFDVYDEWNRQVAAPKGGKKRKGKTRNATIDVAKGKYFIRVYAIGRGDAGKYKLAASFKETADAIAFDMSKVDINDPPKLPAVPEEIAPCDDTNFDPKKKECANFCPANNPPPNWGPCTGKCPNPPDAANPACWPTMPCPAPPKREIKACTKDKFPKCPDYNNPDPANPQCDGAKAPPVFGRIIAVTQAGGDTNITINSGADSGVGAKWHGQVLSGSDGESPLAGGEVSIIHVGKTQTLGKVHLSPDTVNKNNRVKLSAP